MNPDGLPGVLAFRGTKWAGEAKAVVTRNSGKGEPVSSKKITITDQANTWPKGVVVAADLLETWELK